MGLQFEHVFPGKRVGGRKVKRQTMVNGQAGAGAPREITPQKGDTFTITEEWLEFDTNPDGEFVDYDGGTMTFGKKGFEMVPYYAYSGDYTIGFIVEDLNGNTTVDLIEVTVTE